MTILSVFNKAPRAVKFSVIAIVMLTMFVVSVSVAASVTVDDVDSLTVARGESIDASFLLLHAASSGSVSTVSTLIDFDGKKTVAYSELEMFEDVLVVDYTVTVNENKEINKYYEKIVVNDGGEQYEFVVEISVQRDWVVSLSRMGSVGGLRMGVGIVVFVVVVLLMLIISILLQSQVRGGSSGRK